MDKCKDDGCFEDFHESQVVVHEDMVVITKRICNRCGSESYHLYQGYQNIPKEEAGKFILPFAKLEELIEASGLPFNWF